MVCLCLMLPGEPRKLDLSNSVCHWPSGLFSGLGELILTFYIFFNCLIPRYEVRSEISRHTSF